MEQRKVSFEKLAGILETEYLPDALKRLGLSKLGEADFTCQLLLQAAGGSAANHERLDLVVDKWDYLPLSGDPTPGAQLYNDFCGWFTANRERIIPQCYEE